MARYFLNLFSPETWNAFKAGNSDTTGFSMSRETRAKYLVPGDRFICYLTKESKFVGVLEIVSSSFIEAKDIGWGEGSYPVRFRVKPLVILESGTEVPVKDLLPRLLEYQALTHKNRWSSMFRGSLKRFSDTDGQTLEEMIRDVSGGKRISRPLAAQEPLTSPSAPKVSDEASEIQRRLKKLKEMNDAGKISREAFRRHEDRLINEYLSLPD